MTSFILLVIGLDRISGKLPSSQTKDVASAQGYSIQTQRPPRLLLHQPGVERSMFGVPPASAPNNYRTIPQAQCPLHGYHGQPRKPEMPAPWRVYATVFALFF